MSDSCKRQLLSDDYADLILRFSGNIQALKDFYGTECIQTVDRDYVIFTVPLETMNNQESYGYNSIPKLYGLMDTTNMDSAGILRTQQQPFLSLSGSDVLVGIIDTGIDYQHPAFQFTNGDTRIASIWDQTDQSGTAPDGFSFGSEYSKEDINRALNSDDPFSIVPEQDMNGHGTFLAGIAAGSALPEDDFTGAAPLSQLVVVKLKVCKDYLKQYYLLTETAEAYQENDIMLALWYLRQYASQVQKPISILIGLGTNSGDHNGNSYLSAYINQIGSLRGGCVTVAAGNEGNRGGHYFGRILNDNSYEDVEIRIDNEEKGLYLELWGDAPDIYSVGVIAPNGEEIQRISPRFGQRIETGFILEAARVSIQYFLIEGSGGNQAIQVRLISPSSGIWRLRVYGERLLNRGFHVWIPISSFISSGTYFLRPDPGNTVTSPGDTQRSISTTAYNHYNDSIYVQSSRGYTPDGNIVPDLAGPGVNIFGPAVGGGFTRKSGTSVAAAHSAGAAALLLEWGIARRNNLNIDTLEIQRLLIRGARRSPGQDYPNTIWGYGALDLYNVFVYISI